MLTIIDMCGDCAVRDEGDALAKTDLRTIDRLALGAIAALGMLWIAFNAYFGYRSLHQKLAEGIYSFDLGLLGEQFELAPPTTGTGTVTIVGVSTAWANITGLSDDLVTKLWIQHLLGFFLIAVLASSVIYLCIRLLVGKPFARSLTAAAVTVSLTLIFVGSAVDVMGEVIRNQVQFEALGDGIPEAPYSGGSSFSFPGGYLLAGLAVAAVAVAFRIGDRLSRDTKGLV